MQQLEKLYADETKFQKILKATAIIRAMDGDMIYDRYSLLDAMTAYTKNHKIPIQGELFRTIPIPNGDRSGEYRGFSRCGGVNHRSLGRTTISFIQADRFLQGITSSQKINGNRFFRIRLFQNPNLFPGVFPGPPRSLTCSCIKVVALGRKVKFSRSQLTVSGHTPT